MVSMAMLRYFQEVFKGSRQRGAGSDPSAFEQEPLAPSEVTSFDYADTRIPDASRNQIAKVLALIAEIEAAASGEADWNPLLIEIRQLSEVHLPALIKSYIDIPAAHRAEIFRKTGRSASFLLNDGLDKMNDRLRAMSLSLAQGNIDAFTRNMRFIDMRYGENELSGD
jgi:hypothetical protein